MTKAILGMHFGTKVVEALGLSDINQIKSIDIHIPAGIDVVTVTVVRFLSGDQSDTIVHLLKETTVDGRDSIDIDVDQSVSQDQQSEPRDR